MVFGLLLMAFGTRVSARKIQPFWESMAENGKVPEWFQDGKITVRI